MSMVVVTSAKASPGVTTAAVTLAAVWPHGRRVVVAEFDPAGGDLAARFELMSEPGLVSLAAAVRHEGAAGLLLDHCQELSGDLPVVVGPASSAQAHTALGMLDVDLLAGIDALLDVDVIADIGRLDARSPAFDIVRHASLTLFVTRPQLDELQHLDEALVRVRPCVKQIAVLVIGTGKYHTQEIAQTFDVEVVGTLPHDSRAAAVMAGGSATASAVQRLPLLRAARSIAESLSDRLSASHGSDIDAEHAPHTIDTRDAQQVRELVSDAVT